VRAIELRRDLTQAIRRGHPWLYDRAVDVPAGVRPGEVVAIRRGAERLGLGWVDPDSPLRVRILTRDPDAAIDDAWVTARAARAATLRRACPTLADARRPEGALRLSHGEADGLPGLVIDRYADVLVAVFDGAAAEAFWRPRLAAVRAGLAGEGGDATRLCHRRRGDGAALGGDPPPSELTIVEHGARFEVDLVRGQKTGLFLDQRDNRQWLRRHADGVDVLNLFSYTGGFSIHAALGGARHVVSVDLAAPAIAAGARNLARSGVAAGRHEGHAVDAFEFLAAAARAGRTWDVVVCDPPSFAPSHGVLERALAAYRRLNAAALGAVRPRGILMTASCSSHVTEAALAEAVAGAAVDAGRGIRLRHVAGAAADHPVLPGFPEGRYLKFLDYAVD
jgi:23S rRNA (cytosine1962-C5)-methyltransferase